MSKNQKVLQNNHYLKLSNAESNKITKESIQEALICLLSEKDLDKISICELVQKAGVSRTAFYRNYSSKDEVLTEYSKIHLSLINNLIWQAIYKNNPREIYVNFFVRIQENHKHFGLLLKAVSGRSDFLNISRLIDEHYPQFDSKKRYLLLGWCGFVQNILREWYWSGMKEDVDYMANICFEISKDVFQMLWSGAECPQS